MEAENEGMRARYYMFMLRTGDWRLRNGYQEVWIEQNVKECTVLGTYYGCKIEKDG